MGAPDVLAQLTTLGIRLRREGEVLVAEPKSALTDGVRALIRANKPELLRTLRAAQEGQGATHDRPGGQTTIDPASDALETAAAALVTRVQAQLAADPSLDLAVATDCEADPEAVLVAVARRHRFACCLRIDPDRYDGVRLMELIKQHTLKLH